MGHPTPPATQHAFVLVGLPGSGKSTAADIITSELMHNFETALHEEVSDFVREMYEDEHEGTVNDNELGRWSAERKGEEGEGYFLRQMAKKAYGPHCPHFVVSGVRSPDEAEAVRHVFGVENTTVIAIWTLPDIRFERKYGSKPSEDHPEWETFTERNEREIWDWRCVEFFRHNDLADYIVPNNGSLSGFEFNLNKIVREEALGGSKLASRWRDSPFPKDDPEVIAQYL